MRPGSHPRFGPLPVSPACRPLSLPLSGLCENPHPLSRPSARLVSSAFSLCLRPAYVPACVKTRIRLPVPPPTRLVSSAFSLCFPRPAYVPACVKSRIRFPVPPPTRLVSSAFSLCFPRPAYVPACVKSRIRFPVPPPALCLPLSPSVFPARPMSGPVRMPLCSGPV